MPAHLLDLQAFSQSEWLIHCQASLLTDNCKPLEVDPPPFSFGVEECCPMAGMIPDLDCFCKVSLHVPLYVGPPDYAECEGRVVDICPVWVLLGEVFGNGIL